MLILLLACSKSTPSLQPPAPPTPPTAEPPTLLPTGDTGDTGETGDTDDTDVPPPPPPPPPVPPAGLVRYLTGPDADAAVVPSGPGLILMGGGSEPDEAFVWWNTLHGGGDVVVLRTSGSDGYNDYFYSDIGGVDSVETLIVDSRAKANHPYVAWRIEHAEAVFLAGGDQSTYVEFWDGTGVDAALELAYGRGAVLGGTSAGLAVLGDRVFTAENGTVYSDEVLEDPYNTYMRFDDDVLALPLLAGVITDSHFAERDRMGRLVGFVARMRQDGLPQALGIGVDESTALLVGPNGVGEVVGSGAVYLVTGGVPEVCQAGTPLTYSAVARTKLVAGDAVELPSGTTSVTPLSLSVAAGLVSPADPY